METNVKNNGQAKAANTVKADKKAPQFVAGNPVNKASKKVEAEKEAKGADSGFVNVNEEAKKQQAKNGAQAEAAPATEAPKAAVEDGQEQAPQAELTKKEIKISVAERIAEQKAILERHIKLGDELARKIKHRDNLKNIITTLDEFELALKDNADETDGNHYQGCLLTIKDDNGKTFTTKNPTIIRGVAEQVNSLCTDKLEEVELDIVNLIPA